MSLLFSICMLHFVAQLSPGPDVLLIAKHAASNSRFNTLKIIAGISTGIVVWVVLTLAGFTVLMQQWPWIQQVLMLVGGFFLAKMGWAMLRGGWANLQQPAQLDPASAAEDSSQNHFLLGLFTNLANPKTLIYFSSVFSLALASSADSSIKTQLALIIPVQTFVTFALFMLILSLPRIKAAYQAAGSYIDLLSGGLFLLFACWLWWDAIQLF